MNWNTLKKDMVLIKKIAKRVKADFSNHRSLCDIEMDITATHNNGCKLRLNELLKADDFNFAHDIVGISNHIDRNNGKLKNCFLPRYSL